LNGKRVVERTAFRLGDQIQLGYTGPMLKVAELDLPLEATDPIVPPRVRAQAVRHSAAPVQPDPVDPVGSRISGPIIPTSDEMPLARQRTQRNVLLGISALVACGLVVMIALWWRPGQPPLTPENPPSKPPSVTSIPEPPKEIKPPTPPPGDQQRGERTGMGWYLAKAEEPPSVLVQRERDPDPWGRLQPGSRIQPGYHLASLPGYRSKLFLDNDVHLILWGNVPEFWKFPPVLESAVMLHPPSTDTDLDFTLERGRVHLSNYKTDKGPVRIRVHFHQEVWNLVLPSPNSEIVLELWGLFPPDRRAGKGPGTDSLVACLGLYVKGGAQLSTQTGRYDLQDMSQFVWSNSGKPQVIPMDKLPDWWTNKIDAKTQVEGAAQLNEMLGALKDFSEALGQTDAALPGVLNQVGESIYPGNRRLGILCLGALDAVPLLVDALRDYKHYEVRWAAIYALERWITHGHDYDAELYRTLCEKGYSKENATTIRRLLRGISLVERADPNTYQSLIDNLAHDRLAISELAWYRLADLAPQLARISLLTRWRRKAERKHNKNGRRSCHPERCRTRGQGPRSVRPQS
jgi:hypothetical protein